MRKPALGRGAIASLSIACFLVLSGCWDMKSIQDINYLTAIGFDYKEGEYIVHVQVLDFSSVAKSESGKPAQPVPIWTGTGRGATPALAYNELYATAQMQLFYGQINAMLISENVMKKGLDLVAELPRRYFEMRYTPWLFGTKQPIDELLTTTTLFNLSPLSSILHQPKESFRQESLIAPVTLREFASKYSEPGCAIVLPSLSVSDREWKNDLKPSNMLTIDGIFAFQEERYRGWLSKRDVQGIRWVEPQTNRSPILLRSGGKFVASVSLEKPKIRRSGRLEHGEARFQLQVKLGGNVSEIVERRSDSRLDQMAAEQVRREIEHTFAEGLKIGADLLQLEHHLYRRHNREWKRWKASGEGRLREDSLAGVEVRVHLSHAGKLKY